ncbi:MAG: RNA-binding protein [Chloroflexi bacterium]|nr:RNA-binding protein [Chloroflexota bacterium]
MAKRLYVGNLPYNTTEEELEDLFSQAGTVTDVTIIVDRATNRSKGFGFVEMAEDVGAKAAVEQYDGTEFGGRTLKVAEARPRPARRDEW